MNKNDRLVLAYKAFDDQLKAAKGTLDVLFKEPIRTWVERFKDKKVEVEGCVKAYLRARSESNDVDSQRTAEALRYAVLDGKFTTPELLGLVESGLLSPIGGQKTAELLEAKGIGTVKGYTIHVPEGFTNELRFSVTAKGRFEGLAKQLKSHVDIEDTIRKTAAGIEKVSQLDSVPPLPGKVKVPGLKK